MKQNAVKRAGEHGRGGFRRILTVGRKPLSKAAAEVHHHRRELLRQARLAQGGPVRLDE